VTSTNLKVKAFYLDRSEKLSLHFRLNLQMRVLIILLLVPFFGISQNIKSEIETLFEQKKFTQAEKQLTLYHQSKEETEVSIELLGDAYGHQKNWDKAITEYRKLVALDDSNANYHYKLGGVLGMKALEISKIKAVGLIGEIKKSFTRAAELDPKHIDTRWALVELYMQLPGIIGGSKKKSMYYADQLYELSKVDGYLARGYIYEYDKQPKLAEENYKKAIEIGGSLNCFKELTDFYEAQDRPNDAISTIEKSYEKHNKNTLHYQIGKVCADYNIQLDKGERCLKKYIKSYSTKDGVPIEWAYFKLAQISKNRLLKEEALSWIDKALSIRSNFDQAKKERIKILQLN